MPTNGSGVSVNSAGRMLVSADIITPVIRVAEADKFLAFRCVYTLRQQKATDTKAEHKFNGRTFMR